VVSDLMANFPPICKKDTLAVQMALLSDHFTPIAPEQTLQKKNRTSKLRKLKESVYVTEEVEDEAVTTELVTREVRKKKMADAEALQKVLEMAKEIEVPTSMLFKDAAAEVAEQALKSVAELQMDVTAEAENLLLAPGVQGV